MAQILASTRLKYSLTFTDSSGQRGTLSPLNTPDKGEPCSPLESPCQRKQCLIQLLLLPKELLPRAVELRTREIILICRFEIAHQSECLFEDKYLEQYSHTILELMDAPSLLPKSRICYQHLLPIRLHYY